MSRIKYILLIAFFVLFITGGVFTQLFSNTWFLLTYNAYFIPEESNIFTFRATQISDGSGEMWLYGEDSDFYYGLNTEPDYSPLYFKIGKNHKSEHFNKFDYKTWLQE